MQDILAIRHVAFEHLGTLTQVFRQLGFNIRYVEAGITDLAALDVSSPDILVILGGPIGVYETDQYPWLLAELALIERRLTTQRPMLGICLGAQLIAHALGSRVYPHHSKEIGWGALSLTDAGTRSMLGPLVDCKYQVLHWHGDTFDLPSTAKLLASSAITVNQAFSYGDRVMGLQFHLEIDITELELWLVGHAHELAATPGLTLSRLRQDSAKYGKALASSAARCISTWVAQCH